MKAFAEAFAEALPFLAFVVPALAAWYAYARASRQPASVGHTGLLAIGGVLASQEASERYLEKLDGLIEAIVALSQVHRDRAHVLHEMRYNDRLIDELVEIRRALEELSSIKRRLPAK